ncbi:hypothetical protein CABS01_10354 [Colletotrichum abscissum]|uniref:Clr5 domain-containing protein n=1 Tax=Colletotrichum abscissum TaxID=1671311 RepID=A0A9Q0B4S4_9PEZI|nr:uncharacterized protein CABS01_10354 [Colletotrichum abscissum]KAI3557115.1 hypothetical protein CABS02_02666 [Colletotrichum abscissum]KAK1499956.1 hypothetical protein CABS01_10354 [Colletotrichum abscissum]
MALLATEDVEMGGLIPLLPPSKTLSAQYQAEMDLVLTSWNALADFGNLILPPGELSDSGGFCLSTDQSRLDNGINQSWNLIDMEAVSSIASTDCWSPLWHNSTGVANFVNFSPFPTSHQSMSFLSPSSNSFVGSPASTASLRRPPMAAQEWEAYKDDIWRLYMDKSHTLKDTMQIMSEQHNFNATERQYKRQLLEEWGWRKNETKSVRQLRRDHKNLKLAKKKTCRKPRQAPINIGYTLMTVGRRGLDEELLHSMKILILSSMEEWNYLTLAGRLPVAGKGLEFQMALGLECITLGDTTKGFAAVSYMFRALEDLVRKSDITIYATLLLEIPSKLFGFKEDRSIHNEYFTHVHGLLEGCGKGNSSIANTVRLMRQLTEKDIDQAQRCLLQLYRVASDAFKESKGRDTVDSIGRRIEAMKANGCAPDPSEAESMMIALDNMQILATSHENPESTKIMEYKLMKIDLARSMGARSDFVSRCNGLLQDIMSDAIDNEWRTLEAWPLWLSGKIMFRLSEFSKEYGDQEAWAEYLGHCVKRFVCAITFDEIWGEVSDARVMLCRHQLVEYSTQIGQMNTKVVDRHRRFIESSAFWEAAMREDMDAVGEIYM